MDAFRQHRPGRFAHRRWPIDHKAGSVGSTYAIYAHVQRGTNDIPTLLQEQQYETVVYIQPLCLKSTRGTRLTCRRWHGCLFGRFNMTLSQKDLVIDRQVRNWVLLPLTVSVFVLLLLRQFASAVRLFMVVSEHCCCGQSP